MMQCFKTKCEAAAADQSFDCKAHFGKMKAVSNNQLVDYSNLTITNLLLFAGMWNRVVTIAVELEIASLLD